MLAIPSIKGLVSEVSLISSEGPNEQQIDEMLDSGRLSHKLSALKNLVALMSDGVDVSMHFPQVVKNSNSESEEVRKLVYMFLSYYSADNHELALLSINSFQNALKSHQARTRANALRAMCSIRVPLVLPLLTRALLTAHTDASPYVRSAAALCLIKIHDAQGGLSDDLIRMLTKLLGDEHFIVFPTALWAFLRICAEPNYLELIHPHFRYYCKVLPNLESSDQVIVLETLLWYIRMFFPETEGRKIDFDELEEKEFEYEVSQELSEYSGDIRMVFDAATLSLMNRSPSVVLSAAKIFHYIGSPVDFASRKVTKALFKVLHCSRDSETYNLVLSNIVSMASERPSPFRPYLKQFFCYPSDTLEIKKLKLEAMGVLADETNILNILSELRYYLHDIDPVFVIQCLQCVGTVGFRVETSAESCMGILMQTLRSGHTVVGERVVGEAVVAVRQLLQKQETLRQDVIPKLIAFLSSIEDPSARASIVWIVGEYRNEVPRLAPDVLRVMARSFKDEEVTVKLQILNLAVKLHLDLENIEDGSDRVSKIIRKLLGYILELARFDISIDVRDRARLLSCTVFVSKEEEGSQCAVRLQGNYVSSRPAPQFQGENRWAGLVIGSLSHAVSYIVGPSYRQLPDFTDDPPPASVRDVSRITGTYVTESHAEAQRFTYRNADNFYAESPIEANEEEDWTQSEEEIPESQDIKLSVDEDQTVESEEWSEEEGEAEIDSESGLQDLGFN